LVRRVDRARLPDSDVIILDPPRAGAGKTVTSALIGSAARTIVYVSCDSATLARDLARLTDGGFAIESLTGFDLFPLTAHLETVTVLRRSEEHTSELQSRFDLVCRLLLEKKNKKHSN